MFGVLLFITLQVVSNSIQLSSRYIFTHVLLLKQNKKQSFTKHAYVYSLMSQKFRHFIGYLSISDFLKQIPPRNTLIILFFFYTHQSLSTKTKRFGAGCSSPGSWLKINGSVLRDQKVWKKTKELNMCRIYICFEKSLIDKFLRTLKKKISYLTQSCDLLSKKNSKTLIWFFFGNI